MTLAASIACLAGISGAASASAAKADIAETYIYSSGGAPIGPGVWMDDVSTSSADFAPPTLTVISEASALNSFHGVEGGSYDSPDRVDFSDLASVIAPSNFEVLGSNSGGFDAYMRTGLAGLILANAALLSWLLFGHRWMMLTPRSPNAKR